MFTPAPAPFPKWDPTILTALANLGQLQRLRRGHLPALPWRRQCSCLAPLIRLLLGTQRASVSLSKARA